MEDTLCGTEAELTSDEESFLVSTPPPYQSYGSGLQVDYDGHQSRAQATGRTLSSLLILLLIPEQTVGESISFSICSRNICNDSLTTVQRRSLPFMTMLWRSSLSTSTHGPLCKPRLST